MGVQKKGARSHHGCSQCKRRSVKCDELRPACTSCISRATNCQYATPGSFTWKHSSKPPASASLPLVTHRSPISPKGDGPCMSRVECPKKSLSSTEIRQYDDQEWALLLNWRTSTYQIVSRHRSVEWIWQHLVPEKSLYHPHLQNGLFALSAIDLATKTENQSHREALINGAERYQGRAIRMLAHVIGNLSPSNCDATFYLSTILVICAWSFPLVAHFSQEPESLEEIYQIFLLVRKMVHLTGAITPWIQDSRLAPLISVTSSIPALSNHSHEVITSLSALNLRMQDLQGDEETRVFKYAISGLEILFGTVDGGGEVLVAGSLWIFHTPPRFFELVRELRPVSLVILAHYCAIFDKIPEKWWISPWSRRVLTTIYQNLDEKWRCFIDCPASSQLETEIFDEYIT